MKIVIATIKSFNISNAKLFKDKYGDKNDIEIISKKEDLTYDFLKSYNPDYVFFPHWSYFISELIYTNFNCVVFHMTDLPFGRGGSPLQNLIVRGFKETKISAIKVVFDYDSGDVFIKRNLLLDGTADDILKRASEIIFFDMIPFLIENNVTPKKQTGEVVTFERRKKADGEIKEDFSMSKIYDYIRMLDGEGYPNAFINYGDKVLEFKQAKYIDGSIETVVKISKSQED